jgi:hypothetical protein
MEQANEAPVNQVDQEFGQRDAKAAELARFALLENGVTNRKTGSGNENDNGVRNRKRVCMLFESPRVIDKGSNDRALAGYQRSRPDPSDPRTLRTVPDPFPDPFPRFRSRLRVAPAGVYRRLGRSPPTPGRIDITIRSTRSL